MFTNTAVTSGMTQFLCYCSSSSAATYFRCGR